MKHELKSHPEYFRATWRGFKTFEIRFNDRHFEVMDEVVLLEWIPAANCVDGEYTGREVSGWINYITNYRQEEGYVVFSFEETSRSE